MMKKYLLLMGTFLGSVVGFAKNDYPIQPVPFTQVKVTDQFFAPYIQRNHDVTIPIALKHCYTTGRIDNFLIAGGWKTGKFQSQYPFDDSDIYKIIEGASYTLQSLPDTALSAHLDALIFYIQQAQEADGYLFTNRTIDPKHVHEWVNKERWLNTWNLSHELYDLGHLYEAAVAHYEATGKRSLLNVAIKSANLVCKDFGPAPNQLHLVPGHEIIEMGLVKLYRVTGDENYLNEAHYFIDQRGKDKEHSTGEYSQNAIPVVDQTTAVGHAVRAGYLYSGMADVAAVDGVPEYITALDKIWNDMISTKYYLTGGIGAAAGHEGFGAPYELPNMSAYNETCASIAELFWNQRMFLLEGNSKYYDILERTLYNGTISGVSLSGDHFFYPNPLESVGQHARSAWFGCACCPSNICRFIPSIPGYMYATKDNRLYVNLFIESQAKIKLNGSELNITQTTKYPWQGNVEITLNTSLNNFEVAVRIPGWARNQVVPSDLYYYNSKNNENFSIKVNGKEVPYKMEKGYAIISRTWKSDEHLQLNFPMPIRKVLAKDSVNADMGRMAIERGPLVYCLEFPDNKNEQVRNILIPKNTKMQTQFIDTLLNGVQTITGEAWGTKYVKGKVVETKQAFTAIPYYAWANRGSGEMTVWIPFEKGKVVPTPTPTIASQSKVSSSFQSKSLFAVHDLTLPKSSNDGSCPYFHWWGHSGTTEWVIYDFKKQESISSSSVYWFDDSPWGGCRVPAKWTIYYKDNQGAWQPVKNKTDYPISKDQFNKITFDPVTTGSLKLAVTSPKDFASGIQEWTVNE